MTKYLIKRGDEVVKHVVFDQEPRNFANSRLEVLTFDSLEQAKRVCVVWSDAQIFPVKNCLHTASNCDIL